MLRFVLKNGQKSTISKLFYYLKKLNKIFKM
jgi:hypothetical protein